MDEFVAMGEGALLVASALINYRRDRADEQTGRARLLFPMTNSQLSSSALTVTDTGVIYSAWLARFFVALWPTEASASSSPRSRSRPSPFITSAGGRTPDSYHTPSLLAAHNFVPLGTSNAVRCPLGHPWMATTPLVDCQDHSFVVSYIQPS